MKKVLAFILAGVMVMSLTACGGGGEKADGGSAPKGEKLNMVAEAKGMGEGAVYSADIYYEPAETVEVSSPNENSHEFKDKTRNFTLKFRLLSDSTFGNNKKKDAEKEGYTEFKVGAYDAYAYHYSNTRYLVYIFLDGSTESAAQARYMWVELAPFDKGSETTGEQVFEMEYVKNIINSVTYNGLITPGAEPAAE